MTTTNETPGLVCAHHHLYSALAWGMPAPSRPPRSFPEILELVWSRLDAAIALEMIHWSRETSRHRTSGRIPSAG